MKLIYLLQRYSWFLEHDGEWHAIKDAASIELSPSVFLLVCKDEYEMPHQPVIRGTATLVLENAGKTVHVCITNTEKKVIYEEKINLDINMLPIVEWGEAPHADQWVNSSVTLDVEHASSVQLKLYLPPSDISQGKTILVQDEFCTKNSEIYIERGLENEVTIFSSDRPENHRFSITCEPEIPKNASDVRSLGYLLVDTIVTV